MHFFKKMIFIVIPITLGYFLFNEEICNYIYEVFSIKIVPSELASIVIIILIGVVAKDLKNSKWTK